MARGVHNLREATMNQGCYVRKILNFHFGWKLDEFQTDRLNRLIMTIKFFLQMAYFTQGGFQ